MLSKCHWIVLYNVHFYSIFLRGRSFPDTLYITILYRFKFLWEFLRKFVMLRHHSPHFSRSANTSVIHNVRKLFNEISIMMYSDITFSRKLLDWNALTMQQIVCMPMLHINNKWWLGLLDVAVGWPPVSRKFQSLRFIVTSIVLSRSVSVLCRTDKVGKYR